MKKSLPKPSETHFPSPIREGAFHLSKEQRLLLIEGKVREILEILGVDISDPSVARTPERVAKMYVEEVFSGLDPSNFPSITFQEESLPPHELVLVKDISFVSFCEHHLIPMVGTVHIAYLPHNNRLLGLSKLNRLVRYFAKRPQLQERFTAQVADSLALLIESENVAVFVEAKHFCVVARGVEDHSSKAETVVLRGEFEKNPSLRQEFFLRISEKRWEEGKPDSVINSK